MTVKMSGCRLGRWSGPRYDRWLAAHRAPPRESAIWAPCPADRRAPWTLPGSPHDRTATAPTRREPVQPTPPRPHGFTAPDAHRPRLHANPQPRIRASSPLRSRCGTRRPNTRSARAWPQGRLRVQQTPRRKSFQTAVDPRSRTIEGLPLSFTVRQDVPQAHACSLWRGVRPGSRPPAHRDRMIDRTTPSRPECSSRSATAAVRRPTAASSPAAAAFSSTALARASPQAGFWQARGMPAGGSDCQSGLIAS